MSDQAEADKYRLETYPIEGEFEIDGKQVVWRTNPWGNGYWLSVSGMETPISLSANPTFEHATIAVRSYGNGYGDGMRRGKAVVSRILNTALETYDVEEAIRASRFSH